MPTAIIFSKLLQISLSDNKGKKKKKKKKQLKTQFPKSQKLMEVHIKCKYQYTLLYSSNSTTFQMCYPTVCSCMGSFQNWFSRV